MKIRQVYDKYMTPKNLQEHMLRVAALAQIFIEKWKGEKLDRNSIIKACLLHDIAKPINFDPDKQAQYGMSGAELKKLKDLQKKLKTDYGMEEHEVSVAICKEIGLSNEVVNIVSLSEWSNIPKLLEKGNFNSLLEIYCDMRIGPNGVLILRDRLRDLEKRVPSKNHEFFIKNGVTLETNLKKYIQIEVSNVTNEQINNRFEDLSATEI